MVAAEPSGPTIVEAYSGKDPLAVNPDNGMTYLLNYAFGGSDTTAPRLPVLTSDANSLTLTANIRNSGQGVNVVGEYTYDLAGQWFLDQVTTTTGGPGSVENTTVHSFSINVEPGKPRKFLRLKATK